MKGVLIYNLNSKDDEYEFKMAQMACKYYAALWNITQDVLRKHRKHGDYEGKVQEVVEQIEKECWEEIGDLLD
jgi:hypothetical protein